MQIERTGREDEERTSESISKFRYSLLIEATVSSFIYFQFKSDDADNDGNENDIRANTICETNTHLIMNAYVHTLRSYT